jgi:hypothetical protein
VITVSYFNYLIIYCFSLSILYTIHVEPHHHLNHIRSIPFTPNERNTVNTLHTPKPKTKWRRFFIKIWRAFSLFKLQKVRYATKATIATVILATPAYLEQTSEWFREWRMEWALITVSVFD